MGGLETTLWDPVDRLTSPAAIRVYLEAAFEDGDPDLIAAALKDVVSTRRLDLPSLYADARFPAVPGR